MNAIELLRSSRDELLRANPEAEHGISIGGYHDSLEIDFHGPYWRDETGTCAVLKQ